MSSLLMLTAALGVAEVKRVCVFVRLSPWLRSGSGAQATAALEEEGAQARDGAAGMNRRQGRRCRSA